MPQYRIMIAQFPGGGVTRKETSDYVLLLDREMREDEEIGDVIHYSIATTPITMGRNQAVLQALESKCDYILMIDSDMHPDLYLGEDGVEPFWKSAWKKAREMRDRLGIWFAPYCGPPPWEVPFFFAWHGFQSDAPGFTGAQLAMVTRDQAAILGGWHRAASCPTGLMLADCRIFPEIPCPWFEYEYKEHPVYGKNCRAELASTEDVYFSRNAVLAGAECWCNFSAWAGHIKTKCVGKPQRIMADTIIEHMRKAIVDQTLSDRHLVVASDGVDRTEAKKKAKAEYEARKATEAAAQ